MVIVEFRGNTYDLSQEQLLQEIFLAIDSVLGKSTSRLVFKTAKLVYHLDFEEEPLSSTLDSFEQFLTKLLGQNVCNPIFISMAAGMRKYEISFNKDANNNNDG